MNEGRAAQEARQWDRAARAFQEAGRLSPGDVEAQAALVRVEQARRESAAQARGRAEERDRADRAKAAAEARTQAEAKKTTEEYQLRMRQG